MNLVKSKNEVLIMIDLFFIAIITPGSIAGMLLIWYEILIPLLDTLIGDEYDSSRFFNYRIVKKIKYIDGKATDINYILQRKFSFIPIYRNIYESENLQIILRKRKDLEEHDEEDKRKHKTKIKEKIFKLDDSDLVNVL